MYEAEFSQPCLAAIQISLVDLLKSWGVEADAVVGHSSGETAAAYASGAITAEEAIIIAYHRGQITPQLKASHNGSMCAVGLGRSEVEPYLLPGVIVGCENSPSSVTLSGEASVLPKVMAAIQSSFPGAFVRALRVECGYHSGLSSSGINLNPLSLGSQSNSTYEHCCAGLRISAGISS